MEHATCPHHAHVSVTAVRSRGETATVEAEVRRVIRGTRGVGDSVTFSVRIRDDDVPGFGAAPVSLAWLEKQRHLEICLTESFELPGDQSICGLDGPSDEVHLELPPPCKACHDGFLEEQQVAEARTYLQTRPALGPALVLGGMALVGVLSGAIAFSSSALLLMPVAALLVLLGAGLAFAGLRLPPPSFRCIRCGGVFKER